MQTLILIAVGFVSGTALIAGAVRLAVKPPALFSKPLLADPLDRPDQSDGNVTVFSGSGAGGDQGAC